MIRDLALSAAAACLLSASAEAGPVPGFVEEWLGTSTAALGRGSSGKCVVCRSVLCSFSI